MRDVERPLDRFFGVARFVHGVAAPAQRLHRELAHRVVVFDEEERFGAAVGQRRGDGSRTFAAPPPTSVTGR